MVGNPNHLNRIESPWQREKLWVNPFVFPPETKGRFVMLIILALTLCWSLGLVLFGHSYLEPFLLAVSRHNQWAPYTEPPTLSNLHLQGPEVFRHIREAYAIAFGIAVRALLHSSLPVVFFGILAFALFLRHPHRIRKKHGLKPLDEKEAPRVVGQLRADAAQLGIDLPRLAWKGGLLDGLAFGRRRKEILVLGGTPRFLEMTWNEMSRAVALHEMGHIVNGDIQMREWVRALWIALVVTVPAMVLTKIIQHCWTEQGITFLDAEAMLVGVLYLSGLLFGVWLIWAGLIRIREYYADWRVMTWGAGKGLLARLRIPQIHRPRWERFFTVLTEKAGVRSGFHQFLKRFWTQSFHLHPSNAMRIGTLERPKTMFSVSPQLSFLSGLLLAFVSLCGFILALAVSVCIYLECQVVATGMLQGLAQSGTAPKALLPLVFAFFQFPHLLFFTIFLVGLTYLVTSSLGQQVQRQAVWELDHVPERWGYLGLAGPCLWFALGFAFGFYLAPLDFLRPDTPLLRLFTLFWLAGVYLLTWLWMVYLRFFSRITLGTRTGFKWPAKLGRLIRWGGTAVFSGFFWPIGLGIAGLAIFNDIGFRQRFPGLGATYNLDEKIMAALVVGVPILLVFLAIIFYLGWMGLSLLLARAVYRGREKKCPVCGQRIDFRFSIGRACGGCGSVLAHWLFIRAPKNGLSEPTAQSST